MFLFTYLTSFHLNLLSHNALRSTEMELKFIATAAMTGLSNGPPTTQNKFSLIFQIVDQALK